jgi:hypothetical protein
MRLRAGSWLAVGLLLAACGSAGAEQVTAARAPRLARWTAYLHVNRPLDVAVGRSDGSLVVEAAGRLYLLRPAGELSAFAPAYKSPGGEEPYIAVAGPRHRGCSFGRDSVYAIRLHAGRGVTRIGAHGAVSRFARITAPGLIDGIAFDETGGFGYRLLVTVNHGATTTVEAITCGGTVNPITTSAPRVEGGIAVAPRSFGRFAGDLIAPDETGGRVFAITPQGKSALLAESGLPHGGDIGVESEAFVPNDPAARFLLADRLTPGNRHPGDDVLLTVSYTALRAAGVRSGDLVVATEGGSFTDAIGCTATACSVRYVANGPPEAHGEGHIGFFR